MSEGTIATFFLAAGCALGMSIAVAIVIFVSPSVGPAGFVGIAIAATISIWPVVIFTNLDLKEPT